MTLRDDHEQGCLGTISQPVSTPVMKWCDNVVCSGTQKLALMIFWGVQTEGKKKELLNIGEINSKYHCGQIHYNFPGFYF